ncbi:HNH/ENDO VII family nuclease [Streptomyces sp. NPDC001668]|uniref:HNH/ENDO VII family nuclease n=1 Tax=unclassified Streptomyces TaxID=2593676 RepID=UPI0033F781F4
MVKGTFGRRTHPRRLFDNYGKLHWKSGTKIPSGIDRPEFERWKTAYWKNRAKDFS